MMTRHFTIIVIDIERFSSRSDPIQRSLRSAVFEIMRGAVEDAHLDWARMVVQDRGDGMILLVEPDQSPVTVVGDLVLALHRQLAEKSTIFAAEHQLRLRVAVHQGLATPDQHGWAGDAINTACRLCDAQQLRVTLDEARHAHLALIVSDTIHSSVIRPGHRSIDAATFLPVDVTVKNLNGYRAWIQVPGYPAPPAVVPADTRRLPPVPSGPARAVPDSHVAATPTTVPGRTYEFTIHGPIHGDVVQGDKPVTGGSQ